MTTGRWRAGAAALLTAGAAACTACGAAAATAAPPDAIRVGGPSAPRDAKVAIVGTSGRAPASCRDCCSRGRCPT